MTTNLIEAMARAMPPSPDFSGWEMARAALSAIEAAGHKVVPVEPTEAMVAAVDGRVVPIEELYTAMLAAATKVTE